MASVTALIGVIIGALASYLVGSAMERSRWQRQQAARWDEKRAEIYAEYGYSVKNVFELCKRIAAHRGLETSSESLDPADGLPELGRLTAERTAKWESVLLLGNPETIAAARAWHRSIWHMEFLLAVSLLITQSGLHSLTRLLSRGHAFMTLRAVTSA